MSEQEERGITHSSIEVVDEWIVSFVGKEFAEIDPQVLKSALTPLGANFQVEQETEKPIRHHLIRWDFPFKLGNILSPGQSLPRLKPFSEQIFAKTAFFFEFGN